MDSGVPWVPLHTLSPQTRFKLSDDPQLGPGKQGVLLYATPHRARVRFLNVPVNEDYPVDIGANTLVQVVP